MLCSAPLGHVASLSTQKFSSNVMEACLERALPEVQVRRVGNRVGSDSTRFDAFGSRSAATSIEELVISTP